MPRKMWLDYLDAVEDGAAESRQLEDELDDKYAAEQDCDS